MESFKILEGKIAVLDRSNIDTDQIIPKQFLKKIERSGFGKHLFHDWRYLDNNEWDAKVLNPKFELNDEAFKDAKILITGENFGCGSSREHAPWALADYGLKAIIAPSFADIFYNNCLKNGLLVITLENEKIREMIKWVNQNKGKSITIDLQKQEIRVENNIYNFNIDAISKRNLLEGLDDIGLSLKYLNLIEKFEKEHLSKNNFITVS